jgi:hypothetical protein
MKDYQNKMKSSFKRKIAEGIEKWKEILKLIQMIIKILITLLVMEKKI